jgi:limonene-1,2-epoxide hydrolase
VTEVASGILAGQADAQADQSTPTDVVERFLDLLRRGEVDRAAELLAVDVEYVNVGLPAVHGRERVRRAFRATLGRSSSGFARPPSIT